jgi:cyanophycinase-like exopeptidase
MTPRLLTIMGSGETSPTMVKVHRELLERAGGASARAVLLDTPFGFQENAEEIAGRAVRYFRESLRTTIGVCGLQVNGPEDRFAEERLTSQLRDADYVFAGPGSPSYALRRWHGTVVPQLLAEKLDHGGAVTFASAAALTLGVATVPVYEIYKVGEDPHWLEGLDLLSHAGIRAAVVPHFDNAEGGTHDTRFCYLGERRLAPMERELPEGAFVLGVDEHTALVLDISAGTASVTGHGVVTVRSAGRSETFGEGSVVPITTLVEVAERLARPSASGGAPAAAPAEVAAPAEGMAPAAAGVSEPPLLAVVRQQEEAFAAALAARDVDTAVAAVLELTQQVIAWSSDTAGDDTIDRARASLRSMIVELGRLAETGTRDPADVVGPFVDSMLELRRRARDAKRFDESDELRDRLADLGVEVRDTPAGTDWVLVRAGAGGGSGGEGADQA